MELKLPTVITSRFDVARLLRELDSLNDFFIAAAARQSGTSITPPRLSRSLDLIARDNRCNLLEETQRKGLQSKLKKLVAEAPSLHISFASEPSPRSLESIVVWLRTNIHPYTLLQVGLQPNMAAGCVLRTPNRWIDMSLRVRLKRQEPYLAELIAGATRGQ